MQTTVLDRYRALLDAGAIGGDPVQARAAQALDGLARALSNYAQPRFGLFKRGATEAPRGIYLHGDVGRGKSMLMDLFYESVQLKKKRRVHFNAFMQETHARIHEWRKLTPRERGKRAEFVKEAGDDPIAPTARRIANEATVLCFDEFQVTDVADAMILGRLFESLLNFGTVVVMTTNTAPERLYEGGLNRQLFLPFIDFLKRRMDVVHLNAERDYRLTYTTDLAVYLTPLSEPADKGLDAAWRKLTGTEKGSPQILKVLGRNFTVPQAAKGVARFSFHELCELPRSAAEYLALAENFHTLIIDRIPKMGEEHRNEARRFTLLIDTLYDERVKLFCSAATAPEELCTSGDSAEAFKRTASRLVEMQSGEYAALQNQRDERNQ